MPAPFERTWRALDADSTWPRTFGIGLASLLLGGWLIWLLGGQVKVYEISDRTSMEVAIAAHPIATRIDGRVVEARLELGRRVKIGEVLVELDAEAERLALARSEARLASFKAQAKALRPEIEAREAGLAAYIGAKTLLVAESRANTEEAMAQTRFAEAQAAARRMLANRKFVSEEVLHEAEAKAKAGHAAVRARQANTGRMSRDAEVEIADRQAKIAELQRKLADLEGRASAEEAEARAIQQRIDAHFIRAAIDGYLGRVEVVRAGTVVQAGQVLGAVVPDGEPHAVAWFGSSAVGRIRPGQPARLRLDGFPWTQYGTLAATVDSVGNDPLGDRVRVELVLRPESTPSIPLVHGLSGTTEIEVERISPARLVLRAVGRWLTTRTAKAEQTIMDVSRGK
jgi:membrane fusion protein (multidrug efflux system)